MRFGVALYFAQGATPPVSPPLMVPLAIFLLPFLPCAWGAQAEDVLRFINPLIGSTNGGNVFAGATRPYGLAKAVANVDGQNIGGFATDGSNITGFSVVHDSGTGGYPSLGNFPLFPQLCAVDDVNNCSFRITERATAYFPESVVARPGHFAVELASGIKAEMTSSDHAALFRFHYPVTEGKLPLILLDLTDLSQSRQNASIHVDADKVQLKGNGTFLPSFGTGTYVMHFCVDFVGGSVHDNGVWVNSRLGRNQRTCISHAASMCSFRKQAAGCASRA